MGIVIDGSSQAQGAGPRPEFVGPVWELYPSPGVAETVDLEICKLGHHARSALRNPLGIVPKGPAIGLAGHGRERLSPRAA